MASLSASPVTVIIDIEAGEVDDTATISYRKERDHVLWERIDFDAWMPHAIPTASPNDVRHQRGEFLSLKLKPGSYYEVVVFRPDGDPNVSMEHMEAHTAVPTLRKRPEERRLISDENTDEGGTWCAHSVHAVKPVVAILQASMSVPSEDGETGFLQFDGPVVAQATRDMGVTHQLEAVGLLPGNRYFELVTVCDEFGNWDQRARELQTLRRKFEVKLDSIFVADDGDDHSDGEGVFEIGLLVGHPVLDGEGDPILDGDGKPLLKWVDDLGTITHHRSKFATGETFTVGEVKQVGPFAVSEYTRLIGVTASGQEDDSGSIPADPDDITQHHYAQLDVAQGRIREVMKHGPKQEIVVPDWEGDFRFTAYVTWAVDYEP
jgi:hypothetical protein